MFDWFKKKKKKEEPAEPKVDYKGNWKLQETWEEYPFPKYDVMHTYCSVSFKGSDKTFYYRTRKPERCIETGDRWDMYVDDCSEELSLFYKFGRVQIVDRGLGTEDTRIAGIMREFLSSLKY